MFPLFSFKMNKTQSVTRFNDSTSNLITEIVIKSEDNEINVKNETWLDKIWPKRDNYELENWIYFIIFLISVFILSVPFCLIAKYFMDEKRNKG